MQANAISFKPGLCLDQLDSPRIGARQEIFQEKGGYVSMLLRGMSGRRGKSEGKETGHFVQRDLDSVSSHRTPAAFRAHQVGVIHY